MRSSRLAVVSGLSLVLAAGLASAADSGVAGRTLELKVGLIDTVLLPNLLEANAAFAAGQPYVIQLDGPMTADREALLRIAGVSTLGYLPQFAFIADLNGLTPADLRKLGFVVWAGEFRQEWKLDPELGKRPLNTVERRVLAAQGQAKVVIETFAGRSADEVVAYLAKSGGAVISKDPCGAHWLVEATLPGAFVPPLAALPSVQFVEDAVELEFRNDSNRWILQSNVSAQTPVWDRGLHGEGQIAGLIDGTVRESHCMFDDTLAIGPTHRKIIAARGASGTDSHGTHTAGTIAGDNLPYGSYTTNDGLAFAAKLSTTNLSIITSSNLMTNFNAAHADGARCHSNSWGDDGTVQYTSHCQQIDQFTWTNEDNLVAFAVSNGSIATTPENSINVLGVGASQDSPNQGNHCSGGTGPTVDGRRKPEIYAPGCNTISANSSTTCGTVGFTGTSMACPAVTAAAVLVRQYFTSGFYPTGAAVPADSITPTGALLRAVLLNGTVDMTGIAGYPSNQEGFGRLLLDNAMFFPGDARKLQVADVRNAQGLTTGQSTAYPINVASSGQPLRITMVFTGPPATVNAVNPVINNLDLEVSGPGGMYRGNVFVAGQSTTGGLADAKNNVEMVIFTAPTPGAYTVTVRATAVNQGPQGYALALTGDLAGPAPGCYPNCDASTGSPTLTANDFQCFLDKFAAGDEYANCDGSSGSPTLTANDFQCFLNRFAAGCP